MQKQLQEILCEIKKSLIKTQLIIFFHNNPYTIDTIEGIAMWVGMEEKEIYPELEDLSQAGVLYKYSSERVTYAYTNSPAIRLAIDEFLHKLQSKEAIQSFLNHLEKEANNHAENENRH